MTYSTLESVVRPFVNLLVERKYSCAVHLCSKSRLSEADIEQVIREYGRTLIEAPINAYANLDAVSIDGVVIPTWSVYAPIWTREEGLSDLTIALTIARDGDHWTIELDDLHVL
jgi:hypothetical protein